MTIDEPITTMDGRLVETPAQRDRRHRRNRRATFVALVTGFVGLILAVYSVVGLRAQVNENERDSDATAAAVVFTCQTGNRTRPQIEANGLVKIDAALRALEVGIPTRRLVAGAIVDALTPELAPGKSIGFRDCNADGAITRADFLPTQPPPTGWDTGQPDLLGTDGLPDIDLEASP